MGIPNFSLKVNNIEFNLISFEGTEELNRLFKYCFTCEIPLNKKLSDVLDQDGTFTIHAKDQQSKFVTPDVTNDVNIGGYINKVRKNDHNWIMDFHPRLAQAISNKRSEIYFDDGVQLDAKFIIDQELNFDMVLHKNRKPQFNITSTLPKRRIFCQFSESNWNFVGRLCDHWGLYFYFDHFNSKIVFADDETYDQVMKETVFKTTPSDSENMPEKLLHWQEEQEFINTYITVIGQNFQTASTPIEGKFPVKPANNLTEVTLTMPDVNSQEEADYIARVRDEANKCMSKKVITSGKIPFCFPGFLINTDDTNFAKALVVKTEYEATNLNSLNDTLGPNFEVKMTLIPGDVLFRPKKHYQIPTAEVARGEVISDTESQDVALRNKHGEYKVKLLGFDNENSVHPWVRKAQPSAGHDSVDVALLPGTEVIIDFYDNNANCPMIGQALENSLINPPVTNANAHLSVHRYNGSTKCTEATQGSFEALSTKRQSRG